MESFQMMYKPQFWKIIIIIMAGFVVQGHICIAAHFYSWGNSIPYLIYFNIIYFIRIWSIW